MKRLLGRGWRTARLVLLTVGLLVVLVTATPVTLWYATLLAGPWEDPEGEILIVPGAEMERDNFPGRTTLRRTHYALLAWRKGKFQSIIVSGGMTPEGKAVSSVMREYLLFSGVPAAAVEAETNSQSTRENAQFVAALLAGRPGRKVLLTSDAHMFRAVRAFRRAGLVVQPRPIPDIRSRYGRLEQRWGLMGELLLETAKIAYYAARGWI
jgi:uncharacterized SAM-binding protein YcdF (DUF218 family)